MRTSLTYTDLIVFGDSLHDIKNSFSLTLGIIPPEQLYYEGRFSNGELAVEKLAVSLGLSLNPYYDDFSGNNFAVGGARTGNDNSNNDDLAPLGISLPGLADQIDSFLAQLNGRRASSDALYTIWVGPNDFLDFLASRDSSDPAVLLEKSTHNIIKAVQRLTAVGAKNFLIPNMSLGRLPFSHPFRREATSISRAFNASLELALDNLDNPQLLEVDIFEATENIAQDPSANGFINIKDSFLRPGTLPDPTQQTGFFFWDLFHPTAEGHAAFAEVFQKTLTGDISQKQLNQIVGTNRAEFLLGSHHSDNIDGLGGSDFIVARSGDDRIEGWQGNDFILAGQGNDIVDAGSGRDIVLAGSHDDIVFGKEGADLLWGQSGADIVLGGEGDDAIHGGRGADFLLGGPGNDVIRGNAHDDIANGGEGHDRLWGGSGQDELEGGSGDDFLNGGSNFDVAKYRNSFDQYVFKRDANKIRVIGPDGRDTLKNIEALKFSDIEVMPDALPFLPSALYQQVKMLETTIPNTGDIADIYYPVAQRGESNVTSLPVALLFQGTNVDKSNYADFASIVASYGFAVVVPNNLRSIGGPPPIPTATGFFPELPQITEILDYVQNTPAFPLSKIVDSETLVLLGHSIGGAVGLSAINGECPIPFCPFGTLEQRPDELAGGVFFATSLKPPANLGGGPVAPIHNMGVPTGLILGKNDGIAPPNDTRETLAAIQDPPSVLIEVKGTNHFGITNENRPVNPFGTPDDVPPITPDANFQELPQLVAIEEIATWSAQFLRATVLQDENAFDFVFGGVGDNLDPNVDVVLQADLLSSAIQSNLALSNDQLSYPLR